MAQSVKRLTSTQVMISWFVSSSPGLGSVLTAQSLGPASDSVSPSLSAPPPLCSVSLCLSKINKCKKKFKRKNMERISRSLLKSFSVMVVETERKEYVDSKSRSL